MEARGRGRVFVAKDTFPFGQLVCISKEKVRVAKSAEQNFCTDKFRFAKVFKRRPEVVFEIADFFGTRIDGQFYREERPPYE